MLAKQKSEMHKQRIGALSAVLAALCTTLLLGTTIASPSAEARSTTYNLDIPSQSLKDALQALALASQHKLLYSADLVEGRKSPKLKGEFTTEQAVKVLLSGTDLKYEVTPDGFVLIRAANPLPTTNAAGVDTRDAGSEPLAQSYRRLRLAQVDAKTTTTPTTSPDEMKYHGETRLEEIIVTAQKRTENLQDVPVSVQVIGGQILAQQNHNSLEELTQTVPAVHISAGADQNGSNSIFIRGIGSGSDPSFDQSVAVFTDDIYKGRSRMSEAAFLDLDRIEVLKGPQTTFFGNNAIAGALNIVTKKPGDHFDAWSRALYGMFGQYAVEGAVSGPITDTFGARLAVTRNGDDRGWIENVSLGEHAPRINNLAG